LTDRPFDRADPPPERAMPDPAPWDEFDDLDEDDVPTIVLYIVAGLLVISFTVYLIIGGGHSHFH
jgi:hypothetical protein